MRSKRTQAARAGSSTLHTIDERFLLSQIRKNWPSARRRAKDLGDYLLKLQETSRWRDGRFQHLLHSLDIPISTARAYVTIFADCQYEDFELENCQPGSAEDFDGE